MNNLISNKCILFIKCHCVNYSRSVSRSVEARLDATDVSSVESILTGLWLVETGLRLWTRLQQQHEPARASGGGGGGLSSSVSALSLTARAGGAAGGASGTGGEVSGAPTREQEEVQQSVSLLCERVCEAALQRAQADAASKEELMVAGVPGALSAVLTLRAGLTR